MFKGLRRPSKSPLKGDSFLPLGKLERVRFFKGFKSLRVKFLILHSAQVFLQSFAAELAGGAMATAVAHYAVVASKCAFADDIEYAKFVGKCPGLLLVAAQ